MFLKNKQKIFIFLAAGLIIFGINSCCFAQELPKIRELPSDQGSFNTPAVKNVKDNSPTVKDIIKKSEKNLNMTESKTPTRLKGGISEIKAVVGKTQLIKFDEPVKRISITDPALADLVMVSPKELLINGKAGGETSLIIWGESGEPVMFNLFIINDSINFIKEMKKITSDDDVKINFINSGSNAGMKVMISGHLSSVLTREKIKNLVAAYGYSLVDMTEALTPQVMLEVKIVEITRDRTKANTGAKLHVGLNNLSKIVSDLKFKDNGIYTGTLNNPDFNFETVIKKSETEGTARILAEPRLLAITGQSASFNAGTQVPIVKGRDEYGGLIIEYKDTGVNVTFTPTILEESNRILLKITPDINEAVTTALATVDGFPIYSFTTRKTDTTVELEDKQTMVIGGLIKKSSDVKKTRIPPYFNNFPLIKNFLGDSSYTNNETELMIFVTPTIIKPDDVVDGV